MEYYVGIDLGGTNVRVAKVDESGHVIEEYKSPSYALEGPEKVLGNIKEMIGKIHNLSECAGIGIGVPGPVDTYNGYMTMSTNLKGFAKYPIAEEIEQTFNLPTFLDNDANVAGLAEAVVGAGENLPIVYYLTHSTGIGGALVVNGHLVSGMNGYAGEVANIIIDRNRKQYNHLNIGAVENEASGTAICRKGQELIGEDIKSAADVFELARQNHPIALKIVDEMAYDFAQMMSCIAHVCDPFVFVIGGGCTNASDVYFDKIEKYYNSLVHVGMRGIKIKKAILAEPGIIGAAMLVRSHQK